MLINKHYQQKVYQQKEAMKLLKTWLLLNKTIFIETESNLGITQSIKCKYMHFFLQSHKYCPKQVLRLLQIY